MSDSFSLQMTSGRFRGAHLLLEMLVVVASILIAFSLDAWWNRRAERNAEAAHLQALQSDFEQNVSRLRALITREEQIADASRRLLLLATSTDSPAPADSVSDLVGQVFSSVRFDPVMGAYEAVVSSGGLAQLGDDSLRLALAEFASGLEGRYYERYSDELYFDFVRSFTGRLGLSAAVLALDPNVPGAHVKSDAPAPLALLRDSSFQEHLALRYLAERDVAGSYRGLLETAEKVLDLTRRSLGDDRL